MLTINFSCGTRNTFPLSTPIMSHWAHYNFPLSTNNFSSKSAHQYSLLSTQLSDILQNIVFQWFPIDIESIIPSPIGTFKEHLICTCQWKMGKQRNNEFVAVCCGCATWFPFSPKIHESALLLAEVTPHCFLLHWKSASQHLCGWGHATHLLFLLMY